MGNTFPVSSLQVNRGICLKKRQCLADCMGVTEGGAVGYTLSLQDVTDIPNVLSEGIRWWSGVGQERGGGYRCHHYQPTWSLTAPNHRYHSIYIVMFMDVQYIIYLKIVGGY